MARLIQAMQKYGPKVERSRTAPPEHVAGWLARGTGLNVSQVEMVLRELHEAVLYFNKIGTPVKLSGLGTFAVSVDRHGRRRIGLRADMGLRRGMNGEHASLLPLRNADNIGIDNAAFKTLWDAEHPDDPLEI